VRTNALAEGAAIGAAGASSACTASGAAAVSSAFALLANSSFKDAAEILSTVLEALFT